MGGKKQDALLPAPPNLAQPAHANAIAQPQQHENNRAQQLVDHREWLFAPDE